MAPQPPDQVLCTTNPLTALRLRHDVTPGRFAQLLGTSKATIQFAENGCFNSPPIPYRPFLHPTDYTRYQQFRLEKRRQTEPWPPNINTLPLLLKHFDESPYQLANRLCVQPAEIFRLLNRPARQNHVPSNLIEAFTHIGLTAQQIRDFSAKPTS